MFKYHFPNFAQEYSVILTLFLCRSFSVWLLSGFLSLSLSLSRVICSFTNIHSVITFWVTSLGWSLINFEKFEVIYSLNKASSLFGFYPFGLPTLFYPPYSVLLFHCPHFLISLAAFWISFINMKCNIYVYIFIYLLYLYKYISNPYYTSFFNYT